MYNRLFSNIKTFGRNFIISNSTYIPYPIPFSINFLYQQYLTNTKTNLINFPLVSYEPYLLTNLQYIPNRFVKQNFINSRYGTTITATQVNSHYSNKQHTFNIVNKPINLTQNQFVYLTFIPWINQQVNNLNIKKNYLLIQFRGNRKRTSIVVYYQQVQSYAYIMCVSQILIFNALKNIKTLLKARLYNKQIIFLENYTLGNYIKKTRYKDEEQKFYNSTWQCQMTVQKGAKQTSPLLLYLYYYPISMTSGFLRTCIYLLKKDRLSHPGEPLHRSQRPTEICHVYRHETHPHLLPTISSQRHMTHTCTQLQEVYNFHGT
eukprot:TRINITY_DN9888_c0_g2_i2.p1 TRINITY_DN9888_c0_g2~~TRINITY_DN9888_c0_g2_i2.p1  ORF type:complete len:319 (+),score=-25.42 TRINITY_DN9888_c0_g2_i2:70-1026(+)